MSYRKEKRFALASVDFAATNPLKLKALHRKTLEAGVHGLCFSPYIEGQQPGDQLSEKQVRQRLNIIKPYTKWIRSFSCTEGNELIPMIAHEYGIKTLVGAWLGGDTDKNEEEINALVKLSNQGYVDIAAVGNEVMYRNDLTEKELLDCIYKVKNEVKNNIPVGYVDAYYEFVDRLAITEACDVILANCYPFWEGCHHDYALLYMKDMYQRVLKVANGKRIIVSETGWPNKGTNLDGAVPSATNAMSYFINTQKWSTEENIEVFYFSSFDESWKVGGEGDVGAHWGLWDKYERLKF